MRKLLLTFLFLIIFAIFLTSCVTENSIPNNNDSRVSDFESAPQPQFVFSSTLNVFRQTELGFVPIENRTSLNGYEDLSFTLMTTVNPDATLDTTNIPMRIFIIGDGKFLEFSIFGSSECSIWEDVVVKPQVEQYIDVCIKISNEISLFTIVCLFYPEDIPNKGIGSYSGEISYTILNTNYSDLSYNDQCNMDTSYYYQVANHSDNYGIDIGCKTVIENNNQVIENHFYDDVILSSTNEKLYLKFNNGSNGCSAYYLFILCDGLPIPAFNECYTSYVNCKGGTQTYQHLIPNEYLPPEGMHTFQAIAVPAVSDGELSSFSTSKLRVQTTR